MEESQLSDNPIAILMEWLESARIASPVDYNAMALATVGPAGYPSVRTVLLKDVNDSGLTFFTHYGSRKAGELDALGYCAVMLYWSALNRQVRVEGPVARVSTEESDAYFSKRSRGSQLGAWASSQSQVLASCSELEARVDMYRARFADGPVPRPPQWGGYCLRPDMIEFWEAGENRLHDRLRYIREDSGWRIDRLWP